MCLREDVIIPVINKWGLTDFSNLCKSSWAPLHLGTNLFGSELYYLPLPKLIRLYSSPVHWSNSLCLLMWEQYIPLWARGESIFRLTTAVTGVYWYEARSCSPSSADSISSDEEEMRTMGSSGSESSTPDKMATAASIFTEQSNLVSKCKRFEQKYRMALEQKVAPVCVCVCVILLLLQIGW